MTGQKERAEQVTDRKTGNWMNVHTQDRQTDRQTDKLSDTVNLPPKRVSNTDVASLGPSSERMANA